MKPPSAGLSVSICVFSLTLCPLLKAQGSASDKASAEALFDAGVALVAAGNYVDGCTKFEASQALEPTLGTELHLADCYEQSGKTASAWALFKESEVLAHRQNQTDREELSRVRVTALAPKLSYLLLDAAGPLPTGFVVEHDGHVVPNGSLGVAIPVDPGPQTVTASAPSRRSWAARVDVLNTPGTVSLSIPQLSVLAPGPAASAPHGPVRDDAGNAQRVVGISATLIGLSGLLAGVGLGLYAKHENDQSRLDRYCPTDAHNGCTSEGVALRQRAEHFASASTVTLISSGAILGGGLLLWSTAPSKSEQKNASQLRWSVAGAPGAFQTALAGAW